MASSIYFPIHLSADHQDKLENLVKELNQIGWEKSEYYFHNFIDYYNLPQIVRVEQPWNTDFERDQWMYLHTFFDRYLIVASLLANRSQQTNEKYLIPDWFPGECRILSKNPILKQRWWVFQGAFELYRFELPRSIKVLAHTPAHKKTINDEWEKVVLSKNSHFNVVRRVQYQSRVKSDKGEMHISEPKEAFVFQNPHNTNEEFIVPPGVPLRFATLIKDHELYAEYRSHHGTFTFPEIMMRYELPIDIEIRTHLPVYLPDFKPQIRLEKFCVAKSIFAFLVHNEKMKLMEISPLTRFTIRCVRCLTFGLAKNQQNKEAKFDEKEYQTYENIRSQMKTIFENLIEVYKSRIQVGSNEEIASIEAAYDLSMRIKSADEKPANKSHFTVEEAYKIIRQKTVNNTELPKQQPKRFTVHASADPSNPYNEIIDYENMDALSKATNNMKVDTNDNDKTTVTAPEKKSQSQVNRSQKQSTLVVQQLPPPILLPPDAFERTVNAIPERLYTELLPATRAKKLQKGTAQE